MWLMLRYLLIFAGVVIAAVTAAALFGGLGFYIDEEYLPTRMEFKPQR